MGKVLKFVIKEKKHLDKAEQMLHNRRKMERERKRNKDRIKRELRRK